MNKKVNTVDCEIHGQQQETFVCQHLVESFHTNKQVGFWWAHDPENPRPDAWCTACNELVLEAGGEWDDQAESFANIKLVCGACYDRVREFNLPQWRQFLK
ncbi:MAG TPA: hypothetical protein VM911_17830 [Pyrinomonadaceae bacterium]|jgi:hypothetical protein|nr:hypothetical protein [Pyrinomonadaceae bacterium]